MTRLFLADLGFLPVVTFFVLLADNGCSKGPLVSGDLGEQKEGGKQTMSKDKASPASLLLQPLSCFFLVGDQMNLLRKRVLCYDKLTLTRISICVRTLHTQE